MSLREGSKVFATYHAAGMVRAAGNESIGTEHGHGKIDKDRGLHCGMLSVDVGSTEMGVEYVQLKDGRGQL